MTNYNKNYITWKNWNHNTFGKLNTSKRKYFDAQLSLINKKISPNSKVLEIGFGNGDFLTYSQLNRWEISGTEVNKSLINLAKKNKFNVLNTSTLNNLISNQYDLIVAFDIFEHLNNKKLLYFLKQIKRISKKDGYLIARFPNADSPFGMPYQNGDISHLSSIGSEKCRYYSNKLHSKIVYIGGEKQILYSNSICGFIRNFLSIIVKKITDHFVNIFFLRGIQISFSASNLIWIVKFEK
jgi:2-polyprenyl-3-methyl-5-hydroxy-6-metoxy-1,4-benzoquinol methylase